MTAAALPWILPLPSLVDKIRIGWESLWNKIPIMLFAAPKHRSSRSVLRKKFLNNAVKPNKSIRRCDTCGGPKLHNFMCEGCYMEYIKFVVKAEGKEYIEPKYGYYFEEKAAKEEELLKKNVKLRRVKLNE